METKILATTPGDLHTAGEILKKGGLIAFPTETVYGLGGDALQGTSSRKIYEAKGRPSDNPLIVHVCTPEDVEMIVSEISENARLLMDHFWPGPLTLIFKKNEKVPPETTGGLDTVAIRLPSHETARALIREGGGYVAAPSANVSGRPSPTKAEHVLHDLNGKIDGVIEGEASDLGLESTIVDTTVEPPMILRPGFITREMLQQVLGEVTVDRAIIDPDSKQAPKAPGMKYRHYAPRASLILVEGDARLVKERIRELVKEGHNEGKKVGVIAVRGTREEYGDNAANTPQEFLFIGSEGEGSRDNEVSAAAGGLYDALRRMDETDVEIIYSEVVEETGVGEAFMNRLMKAAGHQIIHV